MNTIGRTAASLLVGGALIVGGFAAAGAARDFGGSSPSPSTNLVETVATTTHAPSPVATDAPAPRPTSVGPHQAAAVATPAIVLPPPVPGDSINATHLNSSSSFPQQGQTYRLLPEVNLTMEQLGTLVGQGTLHVGMPGARCAPLNGETINIFAWDGEYWAHNGLEGSQPTYCTWELMRVAGPQWPVPRIASITPDPVSAGGTLTIDGNNFAGQPPAGSVALVHVTATNAGPVVSASITSWSNNQVALSLPASAPTGDYVAVLFQGSVAGYAASARFQVAAPVKYRYTCRWQGGLVLLDHGANVTVEALPDATVAGQCANFRTNDPYYQALAGKTINVFTAPNEFPGRYVVHNGLQGPQPVYGTWTFIQFYDCRFNGRLVYLRHVTNVSVENFGDARVIGQCTDFLTNDPYYQALDGHTINVFAAPKEFPGQDVVHNGLQGPQPVYGTWTFPEIVPLAK